MIKPMPISIKQALWQIPVLIVLAGLIAVGVNQYRSDGIPLVSDWSVEARFADAEGTSLVVGLEQARKLFENEAALFVDARPES